MPLTVENTSALVGGAAIPAMQKRWVQVLRTFVGCKAAKGDVIELGGKLAAELVAANKVVYTTAPALVVEAAPPASEPAIEPATASEPAPQAPTSRRASHARK